MIQRHTTWTIYEYISRRLLILFLNVLRTPKPNLSIRTRADQPRFSRHPSQIQDSDAIDYLMSPQDLQRNDERVLHEVGVNGAMEDVDRAVI